MNSLLNFGKKIFNDSESGINPLPLFKQLDKNGDGKITEDDFVLVIEKYGWGTVGDEMVRSIFKQIDTNENGTLEFNEALAAFDTVKQLFFSKNPTPP